MTTLLVPHNVVVHLRHQNCLIEILETTSGTGVLSSCASHSSLLTWKVISVYRTEDTNMQILIVAKETYEEQCNYTTIQSISEVQKSSEEFYIWRTCITLLCWQYAKIRTAIQFLSDNLMPQMHHIPESQFMQTGKESFVHHVGLNRAGGTCIYYLSEFKQIQKFYDFFFVVKIQIMFGGEKGVILNINKNL